MEKYNWMSNKYAQVIIGTHVNQICDLCDCKYLITDIKMSMLILRYILCTEAKINSVHIILGKLVIKYIFNVIHLPEINCIIVL